jgi:hypothetical protein
MDDFGESREDLEEKWWEWTHQIPFDGPVSEALARLYERKLAKIDQDKSTAAHRRWARKLKLVQNRAARYNIDQFLDAH